MNEAEWGRRKDGIYCAFCARFLNMVPTPAGRVHAHVKCKGCRFEWVIEIEGQTRHDYLVPRSAFSLLYDHLDTPGITAQDMVQQLAVANLVAYARLLQQFPTLREASRRAQQQYASLEVRRSAAVQVLS
jgi:hypothetical protein